MLFKNIGLYFQSDPPAGGGEAETDSDDKGKKPESDWTEAQQKEFDKRAKALRKSAEEEGKKKAEAEFAAKQKAAEDEAEKKRLESEGKFKEASELAQRERDEAKKRAEEAEAKTKELELKDLFNSYVSDEELTFASPQARKDAFAALDREKVTDETSLKEAMTALQKDRSYLFGEVSQNGNTDAEKTGKKTNKTEQNTKERERKLKERFNIRRPG